MASSSDARSATARSFASCAAFCTADSEISPARSAIFCDAACSVASKSAANFARTAVTSSSVCSRARERIVPAVFSRLRRQFSRCCSAASGEFKMLSEGVAASRSRSARSTASVTESRSCTAAVCSAALRAASFAASLTASCTARRTFSSSPAAFDSVLFRASSTIAAARSLACCVTFFSAVSETRAICSAMAFSTASWSCASSATRAAFIFSLTARAASCRIDLSRCSFASVTIRAICRCSAACWSASGVAGTKWSL